MATSEEEVKLFWGGGVSCVKVVETVAIGVGEGVSERVIVGLLEAILSFLKRGILADVYTESVNKNICYLFGVEIGEKDRRIFREFDTRTAL